MSLKHKRQPHIGKSEHFPRVVPVKPRVFIMQLTRAIRRDMIAKGEIPDPQKREPRWKFDWTYGKITGTVYADTRSEARSKIKKSLGIKKRLPIEVEINGQPNI
jgi:hypothetical protein